MGAPAVARRRRRPQSEVLELAFQPFGVVTNVKVISEKGGERGERALGVRLVVFSTQRASPLFCWGQAGLPAARLPLVPSQQRAWRPLGCHCVLVALSRSWRAARGQVARGIRGGFGPVNRQQ